MSTDANLHRHGHCLKARLLPSGEVVLVCQHSNERLVHFGKLLYIEKLSHDPAKHQDCHVQLCARFKVPLECESGEAFELVGGYVDAEGCNCPAHDDLFPPRVSEQDEVG